MASKLIRRQLKKKKDDNSRSHYSEKQRQEAVAMYMVVGNMSLVATTIGIPVDRLRHWKQLDWWKEMEEEIRRSRNIEVSGKIHKVVNKVLQVLEDRVENGDYLYDPRTQEFKRRPISAKTASDIMSKALDKELILQKLEEKPKLQEEQVMERLKSIEETLIRASRIKKPNIIDVTPTEVMMIGEETE